MSLAAAMFVACSDDSGTSANDDDVILSSSSDIGSSESSIPYESLSSTGEESSAVSSSSTKKSSSSSSSAKSSSSTSKYVCDIYDLADALSCDCDESREDSLAYNYDSDVELVCIYDEYLNKWGWVKNAESSSSSVLSSSSSKDPEPAEGSSSSSLSSSATTEDLASSFSSRVILSSSEESSASSSSTAKSSSSSVVESSSSSEYVPFDHYRALAGESTLGIKDAYKQFTDERNGRSYYYITITGEDTSGVKASVTVMAENLNIGESVRGLKNQEDDSKIERYCYRNDTTNCDRYGALYQWAEAMALPSRCNTESCADLIEENHRGICPEGWRLLTYNDFYIIWHAETNTSGVKGLRSSYGFEGNNETGYSLTGAGFRTYEGSWDDIGLAEYWFYPEERDSERASKNGISTSNVAPSGVGRSYKTLGQSVRCVKMEE